jgi:acetolactate synthase-1/2/3 large subunit
MSQSAVKHVVTTTTDFAPPQLATAPRLADLLIEQLLAWGICTFFGVPGAPAAGLFRALGARLDRLRYLPMQDERAAGHSADFFFRVSRRLAVCVVTAGPGLTNLNTALHTAKADGSALLVLAAMTPLRWRGRDCAQAMDVKAALDPVVKRTGEGDDEEIGYAILEDPSQGPSGLRRLVRLATEGVPGVVVLAVPSDVGLAPVPGGDALVSREHPRQDDQATLVGDVDEAASLIDRATRPVIIAGHGAVLARADAALRVLAETLGALVVTSARAKGVFPDPPFHPLARGVLGLGGRAEARAAIAAADLFVTVGEPLGDVTSDAFSCSLAGRPIIALDIDPTAPGRNYPMRVGLVGDARVGLEALGRRVRARAATSWQHPVPALPDLGTLVARIGGDTLSAATAMELLTHVIPQDAHVLADIGSAAMLWAAHSFHRALPYRFHLPQKMGAMGSAVAGVLGAALGARERVYLLAGDGAFTQTNGAEIPTAVDAGADYTAIIFNDGGFGMVQRGWESLGGRFPTAMYRRRRPIAKIARLMDAEAVEVATASDLVEAVKRSAQNRGPVIVDVHIEHRAGDPTLMESRTAGFEG